MSRLQCRVLMAGAAVLVAVLSSRPAEAQIGVDPGPPREPRGLCNDVITGVYYDVVNQAFAEHHLQKIQAKLMHDAEQGDIAAVDRRRPSDRKVLGHRIGDRRLVDPVEARPTITPKASTRSDRCRRRSRRHRSTPRPIRTPSPYPRQLSPDPVSSMAYAARTIPITITSMPRHRRGPASPLPSMASPIRPPPARAQDLAVPPDSHITYNGGGSLGQRRYLDLAGSLRVPIDCRRLLPYFQQAPEMETGPAIESRHLARSSRSVPPPALGRAYVAPLLLGSLVIADRESIISKPSLTI